MKVGSVREIKNNEFRVGMIPDNVKSYVNAGHEVYIEKEPAAAPDLQTQNMKRQARHCLIRQKKYGIR